MSIPVNKIDFPALPKQQEFILSDKKHVIYSAGQRCGKTIALCLRALRMVAGRPGVTFGLVAKDLVTLKSTTLRSLFEPDGALPPILPDGTYQYDKLGGKISLNGGGTIVAIGLDAPERMYSHIFEHAGIDGFSELSFEEYALVCGRVPRGTIAAVGTPPRIKDQPDHVLYRVCTEGSDEHHHVITMGLDENHFINPNYVTRLKEILNEEELERSFYGRWRKQ